MSHDLYTGISEQARASNHRLDDARALFNAGRWRGAMYMAGYAVECLLKTKLMQRYSCRTLHELEDELQRRGVLAEHATVFTHHLELLLRLTQRLDQLRQHRMLWPQFVLVNRWIPAWRYTADTANRQDAADFLEAVAQIMQWLEHNV
jgi:HEPN domain-containing protein